MASKPESTTKPVKVLSATALLGSEFPEPRGAVPGVLAEGVSILAGKPKLGKSWIGIDLANAVASGGLALGQVQVERGEVLFLALEDGWRRLQDRLRTTLSDEATPPGLFLAVEWPRLDEGGLDAIEGWLKEHPDARLVVIDTLKRVRSQQNVRARLYDSDYDSIAPLGDLARKYHLTILVIYHTRKSDSDDPLDLVSGTLGLTGAVDGVLVLKRSRGSCDATLHITGRDFSDKEIALNWDVDVTGWRVLGEAAEYRLSDQRRAMIELLREQSAALTPKAVSDLSNREHNAVKKLLWTMARDGQLQVDNKGRYSVPSNTGNLGNFRVNDDGHGNPNGTSMSQPGVVVTPNGKSTVTGETMTFRGNDSDSYPVTTVTNLSLDEGEDIIAAERSAIENEDSNLES
jgi:hypothetical protein